MPPGYEMIILCVFVCFPFKLRVQCLCTALLTTVLSPQHTVRRRLTADIFGFPRTSKTNLNAALGFLQRGDAALLHAEEVKYIKGSSAGDLGLGHMLIPCDTRRAPFFTPPCKGRFQMEVAKKQKCQDLALISPVICKKGNDKNLRRGGKTHTQYLPRSP